MKISASENKDHVRCITSRENPMDANLKLTDWVYVLIQNPGAVERIVGQQDAETNISFIPVFLDKEAAMQGAMHLAKEKHNKYEVQAIILEDVQHFASREKFVIFFIDGDGNVLDRWEPELQ
jgi:hypothetical protein